MLKLATKPRWIALAAVITVVSALFISLGMWQLDRRTERILDNAVRTERLAADPERLEVVTAAIGTDPASLEYRMVVVAGVFHPEDEILLRGRVYLGTAGFDVVTPLVTDAGVTVLVDRGWVPLELETVPVTRAPPPRGRTEIVAMARLSQVAGSLSAVVDPLGDTVARVDLGVLSSRFTSLAPIWLQVVSNDRGQILPVPPRVPVFDSQGPHLSYAIQWFSFAIISLVGFFFLARKSAYR